MESRDHPAWIGSMLSYDCHTGPTGIIHNWEPILLLRALFRIPVLPRLKCLKWVLGRVGVGLVNGIPVCTGESLTVLARAWRWRFSWVLPMCCRVVLVLGKRVEGLMQGIPLVEVKMEEGKIGRRNVRV